MSKRDLQHNDHKTSKKIKIPSTFCQQHSTGLSMKLKNCDEKANLDNFVVHFESNLLLKIIDFGKILDSDDLCRMASLNWTWFLLFHGEYNFWLKLAAARRGTNKRGKAYSTKFTFVYNYFEQKYGATRCPGALVFNLNQGLLSECVHCGYDIGMQGPENLPLAAFQLMSNGDYKCINPYCQELLHTQAHGYRLADVFNACAESSTPSGHKWRTLDTDVMQLNGETPIDATFDHCERCGVLHNTSAVEEENCCSECLEIDCVCEPCKLCGRMPVECTCESCDICDLCTGCKHCERVCQCSFCVTCDLPMDECECSSEYDF